MRVSKDLTSKELNVVVLYQLLLPILFINFKIFATQSQK
jgi:hypothetical protein